MTRRGLHSRSKIKPAAIALVVWVTACEGTPDTIGPDAATEPPVCEHDPAPEASFRLFAVGHKLDLAEAVSAEAYDAALRATVERDVVPNLAADRPNVLVFPESVAFTLVFLGPRGEDARGQTSALEAFSALVLSYIEESNFYATFASGAAGKLMLLAVTDPTWRAFDATFSGIAKDYGVYVVAGIDVGDVEETADPAVITAVGDPGRPSGAPVYWVPDGKVHNQAIFYDPKGARIGRVHKAYLVDLESDELEISGGLPEQLGPIDVGGLMSAAAMISRDAWMQDALERQALRGANVVLQPEAYVGWTTYDDGYTWPPDNLKRSSWAAVQKFPELRAAVAPMYVGNFFDINYDGQSFAVRQGAPSDERKALLAQEPDTGWAAIAPWVEPDPMTGTLEERRAALTTVGEELLPGGAREDEYVPGTVWIDVDLRADDAYPRVDDAEPENPFDLPLGRSHTVAAYGIGRKRSATISVEQGVNVMMAWEDTRFCAGQIMAARTEDGGRTWTDPVRVQPWNRPQHSPVIVSLGELDAIIAWQEVMGEGRAEIRTSRTIDGGLTWSPRIRVDFENTVDAWKPALARDPDTGDLYLAFVDSRGEDPNRRVYVSRSTDGGASWSAPVRVDPRERSDSIADSTFTNEWTPAIAARGGKVVVGYTHRERNLETEQPSNNVYVAESDDSGATWSAPQRLDDGGSPERLDSDVVVDLAPDGTWTALWTSLRGNGYDTNIAMATSAGGPLQFAPDADPPRDQWFPAVDRRGDRLVVVWQDFRGGSNDIYASVVESGVFGPAVRIDDAGDSAAQSWRPKVDVNGFDTTYIVWEDSRTGHAELRWAAGKLWPPDPPEEGE